jgi:hypothetical protein
MRDFWLSSGHHLLDRDGCGRLRVTDEFMKLYLARPELAPPQDACLVERTVHAALLSDPWRRLAREELEAIRDADARENWQQIIALRDHFAVHGTIEAAYTALVRDRTRVPLMFMDQLAQLILRNALHRCDDPFVLRAAEMFYRAQRLAVHEGSLLAADQEHLDKVCAAIPPLAAMFGVSEQQHVEVLTDANAATYWERSDRFDLAIDLTAGRRGVAALGTAIVHWIKHLLDIDVTVEPLSELRNVLLTWYVGLDANGTRIGDALWNGGKIADEARNSVVGLFRLTFADPAVTIAQMGGEPVYLILAVGQDNVLRMKPQNLVTGLPVRQLEDVA